MFTLLIQQTTEISLIVTAHMFIEDTEINLLFLNRTSVFLASYWPYRPEVMSKKFIFMQYIFYERYVYGNTIRRE